MENTAQNAYQQLENLRRQVPVATWPASLRHTLQQAARQVAATQETPFFPPQIYIEPTNACNCNCIICPRAHMTRPVGFLSMELYQNLLAQIAALGPSEIHLFNFGEPTLHPELPEMIRLGRQHHLEVSFQTNGLLRQAEKIRALLDAGLAYIGVSVNGLVPAEYETIRPGHRFATVMENLRLLRRLIDEFHYPCRIHIAAQVMKDDLQTRPHDVEHYKRTWLAIADSLSIFGMSCYDRIALVKGGQVSTSELAQAPRRNDADVHCFEPFDRLVIKWDGRATVCCVDYDAQMVVGDLNHQPLAELWQSARLNNIRNMLKARQYSRLAICRTCPKFYSEPFTLFFTRQPNPAPDARPLATATQP